ncbi:hypothetical protein HNQ60_001262 [Povalibacter uvarum]|uniref:DUF1772 domain-containing protein n=1 Tax=Povalibacter uvarum TaxID=732238 RepID=A0A841HHZ6_9GAMM|nr:hypothetical protein [Povalibacter uvarum]MBB6092416.1 hypothetical protein [Povalibacter uvarum]
MRRTHLPNVTLVALAASYLIQIGAGFFALATIARTVSSAPPRSLAVLHGAYPYDSSVFWQTVPPITGALFLLAIIANWRTQRRSLLLGALAVFVLAGVVTVAYLDPLFADIVATGYRDTVDSALQRRAASWYAFDWGIRCIEVTAGATLLIALTRPPTEPVVLPA